MKNTMLSLESRKFIKPKKVIAVVPSFYGNTGDAVNERNLLLTIAEKSSSCTVISQIGIREIFIYRKYLKQLEKFPENLKVIMIPCIKTSPIVYILLSIFFSYILSIILKVLNKLRYVDLIYVRGSWLAVGLLTQKDLREKVIVKIPAIFEDEIENNILKLIVKKIIGFTDRVALKNAKKIAVNSCLFYWELLKRRCMVRKDLPLEVPPGINMNFIRKRVKPRIRDAKARESKNFYVGFLGSIFWWQGVDILVKAIAILKRKVPNIKLVIIGDGPERRFIEELCKKFAISYEITGYVPHVDALRYLASLDVLVIPSKNISTIESNIPIKIIEAWALGVPVIATKRRIFIAKGIRDGRDIVFCKCSPHSVAKAILKLLSNEALRERLGKNCKKLAEIYDYEIIAERILRSM